MFDVEKLAVVLANLNLPVPQGDERTLDAMTAGGMGTDAFVLMHNAAVAFLFARVVGRRAMVSTQHRYDRGQDCAAS